MTDYCTWTIVTRCFVCSWSRSAVAYQNVLLFAFGEQQDDGTSKEVILDDSECPLQIFRDWPADRGSTLKRAHLPTQSATIFFSSNVFLVVPFFWVSTALLSGPLVSTTLTVASVSNFKLLLFSLLQVTIILFLGALVFQLKKRPPDYQGRKGRKVDDKGMKGNSLPPEKLPYLVELSPGTIRTSKHCFLSSPCLCSLR